VVLLTIGAGLIGAGCIAALAVWTEDFAPGPRRCTGCGYDMAALLASLRCPECGHAARHDGELVYVQRPTRWRLRAVLWCALGVALAIAGVLTGW
jgi:Zn ribbon nucleic-acid-binding protein